VVTTSDEWAAWADRLASDAADLAAFLRTPPPDPEPEPPAGAKLTWKPPTLTSPTTVDVTNATRTRTLDTSKDYIVNVTEKITEAGGIQIQGGRNVVLIGGEIHNSKWHASGSEREKSNRALYVHKFTGTFHVEGLWAHGNISDFIDVDSRPSNTVLQVQNCRAEGLSSVAAEASNHADVIQSWGGPTGALRVDRLTGYSDYQGIFLDPTKYDPVPIKLIDLRRVNLEGLNPQGRYLLWLRSQAVAVEDVWVQPGPKYPNESGVYPASDPLAAKIKKGRPPGGDFVPAGAVGMGYVSPGYV
jgi:hypothetical protein